MTIIKPCLSTLSYGISTTFHFASNVTLTAAKITFSLLQFGLACFLATKHRALFFTIGIVTFICPDAVKKIIDEMNQMPCNIATNSEIPLILRTVVCIAFAVFLLYKLPYPMVFIITPYAAASMTLAARRWANLHPYSKPTKIDVVL